MGEVVLCLVKPAVTVVVTGVLLSACTTPAAGGASSGAQAENSSPSASARPWSIVALGDSVPRGTNCDCTPYPPLTAESLSGTSGAEVGATNDSVAGYTSDAVLRQLESQDEVITHVKAADAVEIEVGANDVAHSSSCGTSLTCYSPDLPKIETNLATIVSRVRELTAGHPVLVVLLDYWSVWLGGSYAAAQGDAYVATAGQLTDEVNAAIKSVAADSGSAYVDLRTAFKGPDYTYDETHYLSDDGDHPNAAGHEQIAAATVDVIRAELHP